jgi:GT2 family glycosyltransferase
MILTIALVVYNEEKRLPLIQDNLRLFERYADRVSVLIVDNSSTDSTVSELKVLRSIYDFELIERRENNMGAARAEAVMAARTDWLAFLDADCVVDDAWMSKALATVTEVSPRVAAFGGPWIPAGENEKLFRSLFKTFFGHFNMPQIQNVERARLVRHIPTACVVFRRADLLAAGNFDERRTAVGEDLDMSYRLLSRGHALMLVPDLRFQHYLPAKLGCWVRKIRKYGDARIRAAVQHGDVKAPNYVLPLAFFIFLFANILFWPFLRGLPVALYLVTVLIVSFHSEPSRLGGRVFLYAVATHLAYSFGMAGGLITLFGEAFLPRKRLVPMPHRPESLEEI